MMAREKNQRGWLGLKRGPKQFPVFVGHMLLLWFMPAVLSEIIAGRGPDDDEDYFPWAVKEVSAYPMQGLIGVRDIVNSLFSGFSYEPSAIIDGIQSNVEGGAALIESLADPDEEMTKAEMKKLFIGAGYWAHLPTRQAWITGDAFMQALEGEDVSLFELLVTGKRDER